ncbi:MAG: hypothetical protein AAGA81_21515 [Acidobacteriota bacterium]
MRNAAYALIALSFLAASYVAVLDTREVEWPLLVGVLIPGIVGLVLVRVARAREAGNVEKRTASLQKLETSLQEIVRLVEALWEERGEVDAYAFKDRIDGELVGPIGDFVEAREAMIDAFGLQAYADVMSDFASAERYLNRAWSASTDGYIDEVTRSLGRSREQFLAANERYGRLSGN